MSVARLLTQIVPVSIRYMQKTRERRVKKHLSQSTARVQKYLKVSTWPESRC